MRLQSGALLPKSFAIMCDILRPAGYPVGTMKPESDPAFFRVLLIGGTVQTAVSVRPYFSIESWSPNRSEAEDMANLACATIHAAHGTTINDVTVCGVNIGTLPGELPDPTDPTRSRFVQQIQVHLRRQA